MTEPPQPYVRAAFAYFSKGWSPIPLPPLRKKSPPTGWSGYGGAYPSAPDIQNWIDEGVWEWPKKKIDPCPKDVGNIAIRFPQDVIGIDVDCYDGKHGKETMDEAVERLGPLPPTWTVTSRDDQVSGIRLYRVRRTQRAWANTVGPDVELLHYGHRYMVVAPSLHPETGRAYRWLDSSGMQVPAPAVSDVPMAPEAWELDLDRGPLSAHSTKALMRNSDVMTLLASYPPGPKCKVLIGEVERAREALAPATSRHDTALPLTGAIVRAGERGHHGSREALEEVYGIWLEALSRGKPRAPDPGEFERMVVGAVKTVVDDPTDADKVRCCGPTVTDFPTWEPGLDLFWSTRPELETIYQFSRARMVAPWSVLCVVLARVVTAIEPHIVLPPLVGGEASLNLFVALVGKSGTGKGASEAVAAEAVKLPDLYKAHVGSGEGLAHMYAHREKGLIVRDRHAVLFSVPEIDTMTALGSRQGSTLLGQLRSAWTGEHLGFGYADINKRLPLDAHSYRMCLVLGVQPGRAGALIHDVDGGTPQRFLYASVTDRSGPRPQDRPVAPLPWEWKLNEDWRMTVLPAFMSNHRITVCPELEDAVVENRYLQQQGSLAALDGHTMLCRMKAAAALGILNGRLEISSQDWQLAETVMAMSLGTRNWLEQHLSQAATQSNRARGQAEGERAVVAAETMNQARVAQVSRRIIRMLTKATEPMTLREIKAGITNKDRDVVEEAIEVLIRAGQIQVVNTDKGDRYGVTGK